SVAWQPGRRLVRIIHHRYEAVIDVGQRAEARPRDLESVSPAGGIPVGVNGHEHVGLVVGRDRRRQNVDRDAICREERRRALRYVEIDFPLLLAAAGGAGLQATQLGWHFVILPMTSLQADALLAQRVVQRRGREGVAEAAEEVLCAWRAGRGQR